MTIDRNKTKKSIAILSTFMILLLLSSFSISSIFSWLSTIDSNNNRINQAYATPAAVGPPQLDRCIAPSRPGLIDPRPPALKLAECKIDQKYQRLKTSGIDLGQAITLVTEDRTVRGVYYRDFQKGSIYVGGSAGPVVTYGDIWIKFRDMGRENGFGKGQRMFPVEDTRILPDKRGSVQMFGPWFDGAVAVYWSQPTGAHYIWDNLILLKYASLDYERGPLGYPTDDTSKNDRLGSYTNHFQKGVIYEHSVREPDSFALLYGPIYEKYKSLGLENGVLGLPITEESPGLNGGHYNHFQNGAIYMKAGSSQPYMVKDPIYREWKSMGWEHGCLGYPISDTKNVNGRLESLFEHGRIYMDGIDPIVECQQQPSQPEQLCGDGSTPSNGLCDGRQRIWLQGQPDDLGGTANRKYVVNYGVLIRQGNLEELKNPPESFYATVKLVKSGNTNEDCGDANAVVILPPGNSTSASNVYGANTALPRDIVACLVWDVTRGGYPPPESFPLDVTFTYSLGR